ncbi:MULTISPECIES: sensor histidine kinase [unclassified Photobacterium]|uniref:sensor histidine kinase n=1 Tax=unclassified Photobacterium TaxID=2628852 RepID=UPI000D15B027|nr:MULTISPECIES: sensor histidine kinase [unclassified Photobacterium]PSV26859.1 ATP-binding protein [Photobacterium sp. GB-56]PSV30128.1 ATP-binding protein [Photobacterium sp. GB-72]PSV34650.1 ATP-binding protein [Photobacterium sp. GB-27]PSV38119.1 ATP-binding protein [Photobacterium sp. GB-210]PSV41465.1 ATP-binding protein [Photobacterium sp. GB-36]
MRINMRKKGQPSIRNRLLSASAIWLLAITLTAGYLVPSFIKSYLIDQEKTQLYLYLDQITALVDIDAHGRVFLDGRLSNPRFNSPYSGLYWSLKLNKQHLRSRSLWDTTISGNSEEGFEGPNKQSLIVVKRKFLLPDSDYPVELSVAVNQDRLLKTLQQLTRGLWLILTIMAIGILTLTTLQVSWSLWPLRKLRRNLKLVREGHSTELTGLYPVEIQPVIDDLNALLFHYQELLLRARNHSGNLSHALKTPIAILNNEVALLDEPTKAKLVPALQQLQQHIDYHLGRARMAGAVNILAAKTAVSSRVDAISLAMDKVYANRELILVNELDSSVMVAVESRDLDEMIGNLIENSYKWANSLIRVYQESNQSGQITLVIEDDGIGIAEEKCKQVLHRGVRLDENTPGTGLGLNIVNELAHSYRGDLILSKSQRGGLKASLILPKPRN